jgi:uncharacterized membrane protein YGL010W
MVTTAHSWHSLPNPNLTALGIHAASWIFQFIGHGKFEGRQPALLDSLMQALVLAPLFVFLEGMFALGYKPELRKRLESKIGLEIQKYKRSLKTK